MLRRNRILSRVMSAWCLAAAALGTSIDAAAQLNDHCVVSVLNRTVQVKPDGTWVLYIK